MQDAIVVVVFIMFGLQTLAAAGRWCFEFWRDIEDLRTELHAEDDVVDETPP